ncbi:MAG TPA: ABC transporter ATP-binding protein [Mariprofundaceae bacterium]|nr:ABC transporter ATP-binding protein [Mariprofundaceae bacterium]
MIIFENISKTYPKQLGGEAHRALKDVSFRLQKGETLGLIGPNGAGKSTSIRLLLDFIRPDQGSIRLLGEQAGKPGIRRRIGYLPEVASFPQNLTCMDMMRFAGETCGMSELDIADSSEKWLKRLSLWDARKRLLHSFSKGMQQRASFAMALIHNPDLLVLDEPMSGLDPIGRAEIVGLMQELKAQNISILFCSHLLNDVERLADKTLVLNKGEVLFYGDLSEMTNHGKETVEQAFLRLLGGQPS